MGLHRKPCYARDLVWDTKADIHGSSTLSMSATEHATPVPSIPPNKLRHLTALRTIALRQDFFKSITPINVDHFSELLETHPITPL